MIDVRNAVLVDLLWMHVRDLEIRCGVPEDERLPDYQGVVGLIG